MSQFSQWLQSTTGYECMTTFWEDFTIAERFGGIKAVKDTFRRAFSEWKRNAQYLTELAIIVNHKAWWHYERYKNGRDLSKELSKLYSELFHKINDYARTHLKEDELMYYLEITD